MLIFLSKRYFKETSIEICKLFFLTKDNIFTVIKNSPYLLMQNIYNRKPSKITNDQFLVSNLELYSSRKALDRR